jgi:hypothetical protein
MHGIRVLRGASLGCGRVSFIPTPSGYRRTPRLADDDEGLRLVRKSAPWAGGAPRCSRWVTGAGLLAAFAQTQREKPPRGFVNRAGCWRISPASPLDTLVCIYIEGMGLSERNRSSFHKCSVSSIRNRTTPLSPSNLHSATFQFRPRPNTSGDSISGVMPLLDSHAPPKTAKNHRSECNSPTLKRLACCARHTVIIHPRVCSAPVPGTKRPCIPSRPCVSSIWSPCDGVENA